MSSGVKLETDDWRLSMLLRSYMKVKEPLELDEVEDLNRLAISEADLHDMCEAIEGGCTLLQALLIFT